jgi:hypothetical protein
VWTRVNQQMHILVPCIFLTGKEFSASVFTPIRAAVVMLNRVHKSVYCSVTISSYTLSGGR